MKSLSIKLGVILISISMWLLIFGCHRTVKEIVVDDYTLDFVAKSWGEDWVYFAGGRYMRYYFNAKKINYLSDGIVRVWVRSLMKTKYEGIDMFANLDYFQTIKEIDCINQRYKNLHEEGYSKEGFIVRPNPIKRPEWIYIPPNHFMESLLGVLCK